MGGSMGGMSAGMPLQIDASASFLYSFLVCVGFSPMPPQSSQPSFSSPRAGGFGVSVFTPCMSLLDISIFFCSSKDFYLFCNASVSHQELNCSSRRKDVLAMCFVFSATFVSIVLELFITFNLLTLSFVEKKCLRCWGCQTFISNSVVGRSKGTSTEGIRACIVNC